MSVPERISPADLLRAQMIAAEQRRIERLARNKRAREWAEERAKVALKRDDPAYWYVMEKLADDREGGYKIHEPWCFEGRLKIHLAKFHANTDREARSLVYYIKVSKYIKIGTTTNIDSRLSHYPPDSKLLATEPGGYTREAERHKQFAKHLAARNEWFTGGPDLMAHIKNLQRQAQAELRAARRR